MTGGLSRGDVAGRNRSVTEPTQRRAAPADPLRDRAGARLHLDRRDDRRDLDAPGGTQHRPVQQPDHGGRWRPRRDGSHRRADQHAGRRRARCPGPPRSAPARGAPAARGHTDGLHPGPDQRAVAGRAPEPPDPGGARRDAVVHPRASRPTAARRVRGAVDRGRLPDAQRVSRRGRRLDRAPGHRPDPRGRPAARPVRPRCPRGPGPAARNDARRHAARRISGRSS